MSENPNEEKLVAEPENPVPNYTKMFWNRPQTDFESYTALYLLFVVTGIPVGYLNSVILELQEKGASYNDQAVLSAATYPYIFKIFIAPLLDRFYIQEVGKTKTWILGCLLSTSMGFFWI